MWAGRDKREGGGSEGNLRLGQSLEGIDLIFLFVVHAVRDAAVLLRPALGVLHLDGAVHAGQLQHVEALDGCCGLRGGGVAHHAAADVAP